MRVPPRPAPRRPRPAPSPPGAPPRPPSPGLPSSAPAPGSAGSAGRGECGTSPFRVAHVARPSGPTPGPEAGSGRSVRAAASVPRPKRARPGLGSPQLPGPPRPRWSENPDTGSVKSLPLGSLLPNSNNQSVSLTRAKRHVFCLRLLTAFFSVLRK